MGDKKLSVFEPVKKLGLVQTTLLILAFIFVPGSLLILLIAQLKLLLEKKKK